MAVVLESAVRVDRVVQVVQVDPQVAVEVMAAAALVGAGEAVVGRRLGNACSTDMIPLGGCDFFATGVLFG